MIFLLVLCVAASVLALIVAICAYTTSDNNKDEIDVLVKVCDNLSKEEVEDTKLFRELFDWYNDLSEKTEKWFHEIADILGLISKNHQLFTKVISNHEDRITTAENDNEGQDFDISDLYDLFTDQYEEVEEWEHPVDDSDIVEWECSKVWEDDKYEYWESREVRRFNKGASWYPEKKKESRKDASPKKRWRPSKK